MVAKAVVVWVKAYVVEVKMEVVCVDGVFAGILVLSIEHHSVKKPVLLPRHHSEEVQSVGYIRAYFPSIPEDISTSHSYKLNGIFVTHFSHKRILI